MESKIYKMIFLLVFTTMNANAQTQLEQHLQTLTTSHKGIKVMESRVQASKQEARKVGYLPDPEVNLGFFVLPVETRVGAQRLKLSVSQALPWSGTFKQQRRVADKKAALSQTKIPVLENQLKWQFKKSYYPLYMLHHDSLIYVKNLEILAIYEKLTRQKYEAGKTSMVNLIRVRTEIRRVKTDLKLLNLKKQRLRALLRGLLFLPDKQPVAIDDSLAPPRLPFVGNTQGFLDSAYQHFPQFEVWKAQHELLESKNRMTYYKNKPRFKIGLNYINVSARTDMEVANNGRDVLMPQIGIKIPISRKQYRAERQQLDIWQEELKLKAEVLKNDMSSRLSQQIERHRLADVQKTLYVRQITDIKEAIRIQTIAFASSGQGFEEILRFQQQILNYQLAANQASLKQYLIVAQLEFLLGRK